MEIVAADGLDLRMGLRQGLEGGLRGAGSWAEYFEEGTAPDDPYILDHVDGFQTWTGYYADDPSGAFYEPWYE